MAGKTDRNIVNGNNYGNVGGSDNIVINYIVSNWTFIEGGKKGNVPPQAIEYLMLLEVFNECRDGIIKQVDQGIHQKDDPIKVDVTYLFDYCGRLLYRNNVTDADIAYHFIQKAFNCIMVQDNNKNYNIEPVRVMNRIFLELTPEE